MKCETRVRYACLIATTTLLVVVLDLVTKRFWFDGERSWTVLAPFLRTVRHHNYGLLFDIPAPLGLIVLLSVTVLIAAFWLFWSRIQDRSVAFGLGFLAGGAFGNGYDRLVFGFVRDWVLVGGRSAFNVADIAVILGLLLLFLAERTLSLTKTTDPLR